MKKIIDVLITFCVFIAVVTLPFVYYAFYLYVTRNSEDKTMATILVIIIIISHIVSAKLFYDVYVNKYSDKYHDKK